MNERLLVSIFPRDAQRVLASSEEGQKYASLQGKKEPFPVM